MSEIKKGNKYYGVDKFIDSAMDSGRFPNLNRIKAAGFIALMRTKDKLIVKDEREYLDELTKYLK
ncbi:orf104 [Lactobacillus phage LP65]|jgi:hypothetical protein|uniref:Orf104 n=1 Tax=Lactobacillus phage LP65 TaxID=2892344 RepID=Q5ULL0_9CAUD|nr:hypothetical protein LP65_gp104 [Lactobacillus phage LP65]AAV35924.1 orf104 [Lactobacillus phage LP65]